MILALAEAVKDPDGLEMVIALLEQFDRDDGKQPGHMKQKKYIDRVRKQLGTELGKTE